MSRKHRRTLTALIFGATVAILQAAPVFAGRWG